MFLCRTIMGILVIFSIQMTVTGGIIYGNPDFLHFIIKRQPPPPQGPLLPVQTCKSFRTAARKGQILQDGKGCISAVQQYLKNNRRLFFRPCGPSPARGHRDKLFYCGAIKNGLRPLRPIWPSGRGFYCAVITTS